MGIIRIPMRFEGAAGEKMAYALFNSGATFSCLRDNVAREIGNPEKLRRPLEVATASQGQYIKITEALRADFYHDDIRLSDEFMVVPGLSEECIIGISTLQKWRIKLDCEHDTVVIDPKVARLIMKNLK